MLSSRLLHCWSLGRVEYIDGLKLQETLVDLRRFGKIPDALVTLEHPPVITLGRGAKQANIVASPTFLEGAGVEVFETGRGGDVTFHGPGQLVGYPILDLNPDRRDVRRYMRDLEEVLIRALADFGIDGRRVDGLTGVWVGNRKIAALGVRISRWITSHGFALNVGTALDYFNLIVPCGIRDRGVTSIEEELRRPVAVADVEARVRYHTSEVFGREIVEQPIAHQNVQVVIAHRERGKTEYLLIRRVPETGGFWQPVTGTIDGGESPVNAARREVIEETGIIADPIDLDYVHAFIIDPMLLKEGMVSPVFSREHSFAVRSSHRDVRLEPAEHEAFEWLGYRQARDRLIWRGNLRALELTAKFMET